MRKKTIATLKFPQDKDDLAEKVSVADESCTRATTKGKSWEVLKNPNGLVKSPDFQVQRKTKKYGFICLEKLFPAL